jgi:hypothetical protein
VTSFLATVSFPLNNIMEHNTAVGIGIRCNLTHQHLDISSEIVLAAEEDIGRNDLGEKSV